MKRIFFTLTILCAIAPAAVFAADTLYCKWCGSSSFTSLRQFITSPCSRSPSKKHEPYPGAPRRRSLAPLYSLLNTPAPPQDLAARLFPDSISRKERLLCM
jgi:hypothetical protein